MKALADSTIDTYKVTFNTKIKPVFGKQSPDQYTRGSVEQFLNGLTPSMAQLSLVILSKIEYMAVSLEYLPHRSSGGKIDT